MPDLPPAVRAVESLQLVKAAILPEALAEIARGDFREAAASAVTIKVEAERAIAELRGLAGSQSAPVALMDPGRAREIAQHASDVVRHLYAAWDLAGAAGVEVLALDLELRTGLGGSSWPPVRRRWC
jgi:hypothetical protein